MTSDETHSEDDPQDDASEAPEALSDADDDIDQPADVAALQAEVDELKDRLLRAVADAENVRRRAEREKTDAAKYGIANFARDLLSVADNMQRALDALPEDEVEQAPDAVKGLVMGVRMTEKELMACFERNGVKRISPMGEKFDPNLHQAIAEAPGNGEPAGTALTVAQPGFVIADRVLRAAMVIVSSGAGAPQQQGEPDSEPGDNLDTTA